MATIFMLLSATVLLVLGSLHLFYTFSGTKLRPRDPALEASMREVSPRISAQTTMWRAWIGFNASHSMGAILFALVYGYLALVQPTLLFGSAFLLAVGAAMLGGFFALGKIYWFRVPFTCIAIALVSFIAAIVVSL